MISFALWAIAIWSQTTDAMTGTPRAEVTVANGENSLSFVCDKDRDDGIVALLHTSQFIGTGMGIDRSQSVKWRADSQPVQSGLWEGFDGRNAWLVADLWMADFAFSAAKAKKFVVRIEPIVDAPTVDIEFRPENLEEELSRLRVFCSDPDFERRYKKLQRRTSTPDKANMPQ